MSKLISDLCGETDKLESFVLAPGRHDVGERGETVLEQGRRVVWLFTEENYEQGHGEGQDTIDEDEELGVGEEFSPLTSHTAICYGHDAFLEDLELFLTLHI